MRSGLVREVQASRRPPGAEEARSGLDEARRPKAGYFTKTTAQAWHKSIVSVLTSEFGDRPVEAFAPEFFERWKGGFAERRGLSNRGVQRYLVGLHSVFKRAMKAYGLPRNPLATVERPRVARGAGIDVFSREEVMALVRAAQDDQDGVLYLAAAFTGLRLGALLGLRWEDVNFDAATIRVRRNGADGLAAQKQDLLVVAMNSQDRPVGAWQAARSRCDRGSARRGAWSTRRWPCRRRGCR